MDQDWKNSIGKIDSPYWFQSGPISNIIFRLTQQTFIATYYMLYVK